MSQHVVLFIGAVVRGRAPVQVDSRQACRERQPNSGSDEVSDSEPQRAKASLIARVNHRAPRHPGTPNSLQANPYTYRAIRSSSSRAEASSRSQATPLGPAPKSSATTPPVIVQATTIRRVVADRMAHASVPK